MTVKCKFETISQAYISRDCKCKVKTTEWKLRAEKTWYSDFFVRRRLKMQEGRIKVKVEEEGTEDVVESESREVWR